MPASPFPATFLGNPPVWKRSELTPFPFKMELVPMSPAYLYDFERLEQEEVDLENNLLWYRIPSLKSVVFFKWVPISPATIISDRESGEEGEDREEESEDEKEELFTIQPCGYKASLAFYRRLLSSDAREEFQARFMDAIGIERNTPEIEEIQRGDVVDGNWLENDDLTDGYPLPLPPPPEEDDIEGEGSDSDTFETSRSSRSPRTPRPPAKRVSFDTTTEDDGNDTWGTGYESESATSEESMDGVWLKIRVNGRLRNASSVGDLTPTGTPSRPRFHEP
ncbi:hypothetical protein CPB86DRAFT_815178 [Serendipita vermifera]|nr:hypothetical protein CPB86DRAFT_815178 [Serendipita vermifera]